MNGQQSYEHLEDTSEEPHQYDQYVSNKQFTSCYILVERHSDHSYVTSSIDIITNILIILM